MRQLLVRNLSRVHVGVALLTLCVLLMGQPVIVSAQTEPYELVRSKYGYAATVERIEAAIKRVPVGIVTRASATLGAKSIGVTIPGNVVLGLFAPKFAVRMLKASVEAGFEAPLRLYIVEDGAGAVTVRYKKPTSVFAPYPGADLAAMARELDAIFATIVESVR